MINLLPPIEKKKLFMEKIKRMIIILWFLVFFFVFCLILILSLIKIYVDSKLQAQESLYSQVKEEEEIAGVDDFRQRVEIINQEVEKLNSFYSGRFYFSDLIQKISGILPKDIYLKELSLIYVPGKITEEKVEENGQVVVKKRKGSDLIEVSLSGFSPNRDLLLELKSNLESEDIFENVFFPSSNWFEKYNIDFSASFDLKIE